MTKSPVKTTKSGASARARSSASIRYAELYARTDVNVAQLQQRAALERWRKVLEWHWPANDVHPVRLDLPRIEGHAGSGRERGAAERKKLAAGQHDAASLFTIVIVPMCCGGEGMAGVFT